MSYISWISEVDVVEFFFLFHISCKVKIVYLLHKFIYLENKCSILNNQCSKDNLKELLHRPTKDGYTIILIPYLSVIIKPRLTEVLMVQEFSFYFHLKCSFITNFQISSICITAFIAPKDKERTLNAILFVGVNPSALPQFGPWN